jgi:hypothetical protein
MAAAAVAAAVTLWAARTSVKEKRYKDEAYVVYSADH